MNNQLPCLLRLGLATLFFPASLVSSTAAEQNPLIDYVSRPDKSFEFKVQDKRKARKAPEALYKLTSQTWQGSPWQHDLLVVRPAKLRNPDIAFLHITGSENLMDDLSWLRPLADRAGAVVAAVNYVPNQPLYGGKVEDALIAYTIEQYLKTGQKDWPLLFPMVKSAVRAMDAVEEIQSKQGKITRFVVSGASKRGWTTWLTAAVDKRVCGIAPKVIDTLNMQAQTRWAAMMYGRQSEEISDYTELNLIERMNEPAMQELLTWVDPYAYRHSYTMAKLILLGTNDPYWVVDSLRHYWPGLPEPKLVHQTPNAGHDLAGGAKANAAVAAFYQMVADKQSLPRTAWSFTTNANQSMTIRVEVNPAAKKFRLWTAASADRDFRDETWSNVPLAERSSSVEATIDRPESGYRAFFVEALMETQSGEGYALSTEARVVPDGAPAQPGRSENE